MRAGRSGCRLDGIRQLNGAGASGDAEIVFVAVAAPVHSFLVLPVTNSAFHIRAPVRRSMRIRFAGRLLRERACRAVTAEALFGRNECLSLCLGMAAFASNAFRFVQVRSELFSPGGAHAGQRGEQKQDGKNDSSHNQTVFS